MKTLRGRSIGVALAASVAMIAVPGDAGAQRVAPAGLGRSAQLSSDASAATRREDPRDRCRTGYIVRNTIAGGLTAFVILPWLPFVGSDPTVSAQLLATGIGAGIGAARGSHVARERCTLRPR